jgi:cytochrome c oxidase subunit 4
MNNTREPTVKTYLWTWLALMVLLILSVVSAYMPLGRFHLAADLSFAFLRMLLVMLVFMHVWYRPGLIRFISFAAFFWIALMISLVLVDNLTRVVISTP